MSSPTAAYCSPFRLSHVSPLQSAFLNLPLELRHIVYAEIFKPRTYHYKITKICSHPQPYLQSHQTRSRRFGGAVSLLQTCQQIYVETQPRLLLSATLKVHELADFWDLAQQLRSFHQKFLSSSLSGLIPCDCLRRLDLGFDEIKDHAVSNNLSFIDNCRLQLDHLWLRFVIGQPPSYCCTDFLYSNLFTAMSRLRDIKNVQVTWRSVSQGYMNPAVVHASDEPVIYTQDFAYEQPPLFDSPKLGAYLHSIQIRYCGLLNRAFSELTSRPRMTRDHGRSTTLYREAREMFHVRMQELMEENRLYLASNIYRP
jgi:hypothetical protein